MKQNITERYGRIQDLDRAFDIAFWQAQSPQARFDATWELVTHAQRVKRETHWNTKAAKGNETHESCVARCVCESKKVTRKPRKQAKPAKGRARQKAFA